MSFIHSHIFPSVHFFLYIFLLFVVVFRFSSHSADNNMNYESSHSLDRRKCEPFCLKILRQKSVKLIFGHIFGKCEDFNFFSLSHTKIGINMSCTTEYGQKPTDNCYVCKKLSSLKCSNCVKVFYCSAEHQKQDWKRHKQQCHPFEVFFNYN